MNEHEIELVALRVAAMMKPQLDEVKSLCIDALVRDDDRLTIHEACVALKYGSHSTLYARIKEGKLNIIKDSGRSFVSRAAVNRLKLGLSPQKHA